MRRLGRLEALAARLEEIDLFLGAVLRHAPTLDTATPEP
jgi:hypothetical protein